MKYVFTQFLVTVNAYILEYNNTTDTIHLTNRGYYSGVEISFPTNEISFGIDTHIFGTHTHTNKILFAEDELFICLKFSSPENKKFSEFI